MNYIDKMMHMLEEGYTFEEITENLYLVLCQDLVQNKMRGSAS